MKTIEIIFKAMSCLLTFLISCLFFISCENSDGIDYKIEIPEKFLEIGKLHNQGLNHVYIDLKEAIIEESNNDNKLRSTINYRQIVENSVLDFCKQNNSLKHDYEYISQNIGQINTTKLRSSSDNIANLSITQQECMNKLSVILESFFKTKDVERLKSDINVLNKQASSELDGADLDVIYCATSIAFATAQYWNKNFKKWYFALKYPEILLQYNEEQLNNIQSKSMLRSGDLFSEAWDSVENWWADTMDAFDNWWDEYSDDIIALGEADINGGVSAWCVTLGNPSFAAGYAIFSSGMEALDTWY